MLLRYYITSLTLRYFRHMTLILVPDGLIWPDVGDACQVRPSGTRMNVICIYYGTAEIRKTLKKPMIQKIIAYVTFETIYRSGGLIDSCSAWSVFTECHCGRLGDACAVEREVLGAI